MSGNLPSSWLVLFLPWVHHRWWSAQVFNGPLSGLICSSLRMCCMGDSSVRIDEQSVLDQEQFNALDVEYHEGSFDGHPVWSACHSVNDSVAIDMSASSQSPIHTALEDVVEQRQSIDETVNQTSINHFRCWIEPFFTVENAFHYAILAQPQDRSENIESEAPTQTEREQTDSSITNQGKQGSNFCFAKIENRINFHNNFCVAQMDSFHRVSGEQDEHSVVVEQLQRLFGWYVGCGDKVKLFQVGHRSVMTNTSII